jgi:hypothetical protein
MVAAQFYLRQPDDVLLWRLAAEFDQPAPASHTVSDPDAVRDDRRLWPGSAHETDLCRWRYDE